MSAANGRITQALGVDQLSFSRRLRQMLSLGFMALLRTERSKA